jgi:hypothetical protein
MARLVHNKLNDGAPWAIETALEGLRAAAHPGRAIHGMRSVRPLPLILRLDIGQADVENFVGAIAADLHHVFRGLSVSQRNELTACNSRHGNQDALLCKLHQINPFL